MENIKAVLESLNKICDSLIETVPKEIDMWKNLTVDKELERISSKKNRLIREFIKFNHILQKSFNLEKHAHLIPKDLQVKIEEADQLLENNIFALNAACSVRERLINYVKQDLAQYKKSVDSYTPYGNLPPRGSTLGDRAPRIICNQRL